MSKPGINLQTVCKPSVVVLIFLSCCLLIYFSNHFTHEKIEGKRQLSALRVISEVMPLPFDNNIYEDWLDIPELSTRAYRARTNHESTGLVFMPVNAKGYNGNISMAIGLAFNGQLTGVRIIEQNETPGLGDQIDSRITDWSAQFSGRSLANSAKTAWAVASENGEFDALSGATTSPRAVINAVKSILDYYELHRNELYIQKVN